jgi:hypothetical protein
MGLLYLAHRFPPFFSKSLWKTHKDLAFRNQSGGQSPSQPIQNAINRHPTSHETCLNRGHLPGKGAFIEP